MSWHPASFGSAAKHKLRPLEGQALQGRGSSYKPYTVTIRGLRSQFWAPCHHDLILRGHGSSLLRFRPVTLKLHEGDGNLQASAIP